MPGDKKPEHQKDQKVDTTGFHIDEIKAIVEMLKQNEITEFKLEREGEKIFLKRGSLDPQVIHVQAPATSFQPTNYAANAPANSPQAALPITSTQSFVAPEAPQPTKKFHEVKSPMVGTFYRRSSVDAPPYVEVGTVVKKGQTLCIVEAMKIMNEIQSDAAGTIVEVCLEDAKMTEFGEVLFRIDPV